MTSLFDRSLLFIVGKGGVGKSTVATALALAAVRRKKRVLLVGLDFDDRARSIAGLRQAEGRDPVEALPGFFRQNVEGKAALEEYLHLIIPVRRVLKAVFDSKVYQYFVAAAPGLKELMTIGKIWYEVDRGRWDLVIVDSPATGHALQYLRMPKTASEAFTTGLVHREAKRVWSLLSRPEGDCRVGRHRGRGAAGQRDDHDLQSGPWRARLAGRNSVREPLPRARLLAGGARAGVGLVAQGRQRAV